MKTAEVAIEHVLAGLLALCAFVLPLLSGTGLDQKILQGDALIGVLGLAYLFGIVFDKLADTILSPVEQWLRLREANENLRKNELCYKGDPFPQDALEFSLRGNKDGRVEWMDSLRSRIRTSRGLAVLGLPATMGLVIYQSSMRDICGFHQQGWNLCTHLSVLVNLLFIVGSTWIVSTKKYRLPRTDKLCKECGQTREIELKKATKQMVYGISFYILMMISSTVTMIIITASEILHFKFAAIGLCGTVATLFALWVWYKITGTHMRFVYQQMPKLLLKAG